MRRDKALSARVSQAMYVLHSPAYTVILNHHPSNHLILISLHSAPLPLNLNVVDDDDDDDDDDEEEEAAAHIQGYASFLPPTSHSLLPPLSNVFHCRVKRKEIEAHADQEQCEDAQKRFVSLSVSLSSPHHHTSQSIKESTSCGLS